MERKGYVLFSTLHVKAASLMRYLLYLSALLISTEADNLPQSSQFPLCLERNHSTDLTAHDNNYPTQASAGLHHHTILTFASSNNLLVSSVTFSLSCRLYQFLSLTLCVAGFTVELPEQAPCTSFPVGPRQLLHQPDRLCSEWS